MRHAKSDWGGDSTCDRDRPLADRGRKDAPRIARWFVENDLIPEVLLCSAAKRTMQTAELLLNEWGEGVQTFYDRRLYLAGPEQILEVVRGDHLDCKRLMVLGHNPGMAGLAGHLGADVIPKFSTAAVAVFDIDVRHWNDPWRKVTLVHQVAPKTLP